MRLWHKELLSVLPRQQLLGQWRECCAIAKSIAENGTPNHVLVNRIMDYPLEHFCAYINLVEHEMRRRGYRCDIGRVMRYLPNYGDELLLFHEIFPAWHNIRYLRQSLFKLQEKYDAGAIPEDEWSLIVERFGKDFDHLHVYAKEAE